MVIMPDDRNAVALIFDEFALKFRSLNPVEITEETTSERLAECPPDYREHLDEATRYGWVLLERRMIHLTLHDQDTDFARTTEAEIARILLTLMKENVLPLSSSLKVRALLINVDDADAVVDFWWDGVVSHVLKDRRDRPSSTLSRFDSDALTCDRIASMLRDEPVHRPGLGPDLTLKGLSDLIGECDGTIRNAAKKAGIKVGQGQHHYRYTPKEVYRIAVIRVASPRCLDVTRQRWNQLLRSINQPEVGAINRAKRRTK